MYLQYKAKINEGREQYIEGSFPPSAFRRIDFQHVGVYFAKPAGT